PPRNRAPTLRSPRESISIGPLVSSLAGRQHNTSRARGVAIAAGPPCPAAAPTASFRCSTCNLHGPTHGHRSPCYGAPPMTVVVLFIVHWQLSLFCQSFFLHRYGAHRQFTMSRRWERFFDILTAIAQNSSYLNPRGYAVLHRMHHAYSDGDKDPHSPSRYAALIPGLFQMMYRTKRIYHSIAYFETTPEARFDGEFPSSRFLQWMGKSWLMRVLWGSAFFAFYLAFATAPWQWLLLPGH